MIDGVRRTGGIRRAARAALLALLAATAGCAASEAPKGSDTMLKTMLKVIGESDGVFLVRTGAVEETTIQGKPVQRIPTEVLEAFKGMNPGGKSLWVTIPVTGPGMTQVDPNSEVVFFLRMKAGAWTPPPFSDPLPVPAKNREAFLQGMREYARAALPSATATVVRLHLLKMLLSGIAVFQEDASKSALDVKGWTPEELASLELLVLGNDEREPLQGLARENVIPTILKHAERAQATAFGRKILAGGEYREPYIGLSERPPKEAGEIAQGFLDDPEEAVVANGLRVAGLLRRADLLDAFAKRYEGRTFPPALAGPLAEARKFVAREL